MKVSQSKTTIIKEDDAVPTNAAGAIAGTGGPGPQGTPPGPTPVYGLLKRRRVILKGVLPSGRRQQQQQ